ncbi:recombinase family protein [Peribacillus loiseleuriae]|uniref:recombinase family protein n=1 Tax=Peribacillus loiseleuriae TaxID=1679170 RepID=UPI0037F1D22C
MRAAIYVRVSTNEQAQEGFSIPAQRERLNAFCLSQGWKVVGEYIEEGKSAKDLDRPKMKKMLRDIKKGEIDIILVYRLDRLTRSVLDLYKLLQEFEKYNVSFKSATEVYDTSTAMGRLFITLVAALAQWERENLAERVIFGMEQMISEGMKPGGHSPYGYHFDKNFNCTINEEEAKYLKKIFEWYLQGFGYRSIAVRLNDLKVKPRLANEWSHNTIRCILINDMYIGTYRWGSKVIPNNHPPLISEFQFLQVQKKIKSKNVSRETLGKYPLTGILRCGSCDEYSMQGFFDKRDQKTYYRCMNCTKITWDKRIIEPLIDEIEKLITSKEYFLSKVKKQNQPTTVNIKEIETKIKKIQSQKEKWYDLFTDENNPIPKNVLFEKINKLNEKEQELSEIISDIDFDLESPDEKFAKLQSISGIRMHYFNSDTFHQKELLHSIFEKMVITRERGKNKPLTINYTLK